MLWPHQGRRNQQCGRGCLSRRSTCGTAGAGRSQSRLRERWGHRYIGRNGWRLDGMPLRCRLAADAWFQVQDAEYLRNIATRTALGPGGAHQRPVEPLPHPESIFSDLPRKGEHELVLGNTTPARAVVLPDPKPIAKSIAVRAWRLSTSDGQTMYITKVGRLAREAFADQPSDTPEPNQPPSSVGAPADTAIDSDADPKNSLYVEFCRQLRSIFGSSEFKRKDVEKTLISYPVRSASGWNAPSRTGKSSGHRKGPPSSH